MKEESCWANALARGCRFLCTNQHLRWRAARRERQTRRVRITVVTPDTLESELGDARRSGRTQEGTRCPSDRVTDKLPHQVVDPKLSPNK